MSDTILGGDFTVYYKTEDRQKRVEYSGTTALYTWQELYSALANLLDGAVRGADGQAMSYDTSRQYNLGLIDAGDIDDPWFMDKTTAEYLTGGSCQTVGWARVQDSNCGIVMVQCSVTAFGLDQGDIGDTCTHSSGDTGTILDVNESNYEVYVRPTSNAAANNWDTASGTITADTSVNVATVTVGAVTGEQLWASLYSTGLATLQTNTHIGIFQDGSAVTRYKSLVSWWANGDIDLCIPLYDAAGAEIDEGFQTIVARRPLTEYSFFITDISAGGYNPVPLNTKVDINNIDGYRTMTGLSITGGPFTVGEVITDDSDGTISAQVTAAGADWVEYFLIGDPLTDFGAGTGQFTGVISTAFANAVAPADVNAGLLTGLSIVHASNETFDINEDGTTENYSVVIDCSAELVADAFQWTQLITARGQTGTGNTDGIEGQQYFGSDNRVLHGGITGSLVEGDVVTQKVTGATGTVVASNTTDDILILRNSRGTFSDTDQIYETIDSNYVVPTSVTVLSPVAPAPFGFFAGGKWFLANGCVLDNVPAADVNNWQTTDDNGTPRARPLKVTATIGNSRVGDWIWLFETESATGPIKTGTYTVDATQGAYPQVTLKVDPAIDAKVPGKSTGGVLVVTDISTGDQYRYRFLSWAGDLFTLFQTAARTDDGGSASTIVDSSEDFVADGILVGDIAFNVTEDTYGYVESVATNTLGVTNVGSSRPVTNWNTDSYRIGVTVFTEASTDEVIAPFIDKYETVGSDGTPGEEAESVTYVIDIPVLARARFAGDIKPWSTRGTIGEFGLNLNITRLPDTVHS